MEETIFWFVTCSTSNTSFLTKTHNWNQRYTRRTFDSTVKRNHESYTKNLAVFGSEGPPAGMEAKLLLVLCGLCGLPFDQCLVYLFLASSIITFLACSPLPCCQLQLSVTQCCKVICCYRKTGPRQASKVTSGAFWDGETTRAKPHWLKVIKNSFKRK